MTKTTNLLNLFYGFQRETNTALRLEDELEAAQKGIQDFTKQILSAPELKEALTTTGIVHGGLIFKKKMNTLAGTQAFYLDVENYVEPVNAYMLDTDLEGLL